MTEPKRAANGPTSRQQMKGRAGTILFMVLYAAIGGLLIAIAYVPPYGWIFSVVGIVLLTLIYLFWPYIRTIPHHRPKRAVQ